MSDVQDDEKAQTSQRIPSATYTKSRDRRRSLRLLTTTTSPEVPIPPSLQHSPHLTSSVFSQSLSSSSLPSDEDEKWLQDTIPLLTSPGSPDVVALRLPGVATEGGKGSLTRRGSILQLSRRPKPDVMTSHTEEENGHHPGASTKLRTDLLAPPSLLLFPDARRATSLKERASLAFNRRRWSTSPHPPVAFNLEPLSVKRN